MRILEPLSSAQAHDQGGQARLSHTHMRFARWPGCTPVPRVGRHRAAPHKRNAQRTVHTPYLDASTQRAIEHARTTTR